MNHSNAWPFKKTAAFHSVRQILLIALPPLRFPEANLFLDRSLPLSQIGNGRSITNEIFRKKYYHLR